MAGLIRSGNKMKLLQETLMEIFGKNNYLSSEEAHLRYSTNTISAEKNLLGAVILENSAQIPDILRLANFHLFKIYPISIGNNWGYGSSLPVAQTSLIVDLSKLNRIIEFNAKLGFVVLEPGVTQKDLYDFIQKNNLEYMVPTTGAGPLASVLGNALERGYGMTPIEDHTASLLSVRAYLPNGEIYKSQINEFGGFRSDEVFKWKIGPYLDGLFSQSNLGIVFQATIALAKKPENITQFISFIKDDNLEDAIDIVRRIKMQIGNTSGGINIMNKRRLLSMVNSFDNWPLDYAAGENFIRDMAKSQNLPDWMILGGLYGPQEMIAGASEVISRELNTITNKTIFINRSKIGLLKSITKFLPLKNIRKIADSLESAIDVLEGKPAQVALPLAYLKNPIKPDLTKTDFLSPDRDNCGLIWFSPLLPVNGNLVRDFVSEVHRICLYYDIEPLVTLTLISERCFDSTIPILYDKGNPKQVTNARKCHEALIKMAPELGIFPYRLDVRSMGELYENHQGVASKLWTSIKEKVDPNNILSPGRYHKNS